MNATLILLAVLKSLLVLGWVMTLAGVLTWVDRRQGAMIQDRVGPNRAVIWLPTVVAQGLLFLPALVVAVLVAYLPLWLGAQGRARTRWAFLFAELTVFALWSTLLIIAGLVRRRGVRNAFDLFVAWLGDPRRILYAGLGAHVVVILAGLMLLDTQAGYWLR